MSRSAIVRVKEVNLNRSRFNVKLVSLTILGDHEIFQTLGPISIILLTGSALEATFPWLTMWLLDVFFFDIPEWALWLLFGLPPVLTLCAILSYYIVGARAKQNSKRPA